MKAVRMTGTVIVGAGLAGLTVAQQASDVVTIIEAGPDTNLRHKNALPQRAARDLWHRTDTDPTFRQYWRSKSAPHFREGSGIRQRVGGRSLYWHGVCLPIEPRALFSWPSDVVSRLSASAETIGSYEEALEYLTRWQSTSTGQSSLGGCRSEREARFIHVLADAGYISNPVPQAYQEVVRNSIGVQLPYSPVEEMLRTKHHIITGQRVIEVVQSPHGLEIATQGAQGTLTVAAERVVLAAGTLENTRIVGQFQMNANETDTRRFLGLNDHIVQGFVAKVPKARWAIPTGPGRAFCYMPVLDEACSNLFWEILPSLGDGSERLAVWAMGEKLRGNTSVLVEKRAPGEPAGVTISEVVQPTDLHVAKAQATQLAQVAHQLLGVSPDHVRLSADDFQAGRPSWIEALDHLERNANGEAIRICPYVYPLGSVDHESGTLPLGGVLRSDGAVRESPELSVVGPSTFARSGAANPSLTTLALSRQHLRGWKS
jgi:choline dehydrogenase-like flavoprotein